MLIAGQGKHRIDAAPVADRPGIGVVVEEGGARIVRDPGPTVPEIGIAVDGGLFGQVTGTDVVFGREAGSGAVVLAVREGSARVTIPRAALLRQEGVPGERPLTPSDGVAVAAGCVSRRVFDGDNRTEGADAPRLFFSGHVRIGGADEIADLLHGVRPTIDQRNDSALCGSSG